jgi:hypothetical protein
MSLDRWGSLNSEHSTSPGLVPTLYEQQHVGDFSDIGGPVLNSSQLNPIALKYFQLYPAPNLPGRVNNFTYSSNRTQTSDTFDLRVDQKFSDRDRFFARYSYNNVTTNTPDSLPAVNGISPGGSAISYPPGSGVKSGVSGLKRLEARDLAENVFGQRL